MLRYAASLNSEYYRQLLEIQKCMYPKCFWSELEPHCCYSFFVLLRSDCQNLVQFDKISFCFFSNNMPYVCTTYSQFVLSVAESEFLNPTTLSISFKKRVSFQELWSFHYYLSEMKPFLCEWDREIMLWDSKTLRVRVPSEIHTSQWAKSWFLVLKCKPWTTMRERERERERFYEALILHHSINIMLEVLVMVSVCVHTPWCRI